MSRAAAVATALAMVVAGCGSGSPDRVNRTKSPTLTVFAAASLKAPFTEIGRQFEDQNDGVTVRFSFAGSSDLVAQVRQGAPADVLALADTTSMDIAARAGATKGSVSMFATNRLAIATPPGNPAGVTSLEDLAAPGITVVVCAEQVPCGAAAKKAEAASGIDIKAVSEEQSVTDVLGKVISGEADAGLVYVTDVLAAGAKVVGIKLTGAAEAVNTYPIAAIKRNASDGLAEDFISFVTGPEGQHVLDAAGFGKP